MSFEVSSAKREVIRKMTERDWTPTALAEELDKSTSTVYNHLEDLTDDGVLQKQQVAGKTRPRTEYSLGDGFVQYIAAMPEGFSERSLPLDWSKRAILRIWAIPQPEFHRYLEELWSQINHYDNVKAMAVYGSVARGDADTDSDIDVLLIAAHRDAEKILNEELSMTLIRTEEPNKISAATVYTEEDYRESLDAESDFLRSIQEELHVIYDPEGIL